MHPLRQAAAHILPRVLPTGTSAVLLSIAERYAQYRRYRRSDSRTATQTIDRAVGLAVQRGPFQGMLYPAANAYSRHAIPKLVGCYEEELHAEIAARLADPTYRRFVDIGCAEGYYCVGFAYATGKPVYGFEIEPFERRHTRRMAKANGVETLVCVNGWCSPEVLEKLCMDRSCILCDCEGFEASLFTPSLAQALRHSDLIVELHRVPKIDATVLILERFAATHDVQLIDSRPRRASDYPELARLGLYDDRHVSEFREPGQQWAILSARLPAVAPSQSEFISTARKN